MLLGEPHSQVTHSKWGWTLVASTNSMTSLVSGKNIDLAIGRDTAFQWPPKICLTAISSFRWFVLVQHHAKLCCFSDEGGPHTSLL
jgi:hypothetical protein